MMRTNAAHFPDGLTDRTALEPVVWTPRKLRLHFSILWTDDKTAQGEGYRHRHTKKQGTRFHVSDARVQHWSRQGEGQTKNRDQHESPETR